MTNHSPRSGCTALQRTRFASEHRARCSLAKPVRCNAVQPLRGLWLVIVMSLVSCGEAETNIKPDADTDAPISAEQARLEDFFAATWEEDLARFPASASYLGVKDQQDQWNDVSESFQLESLEITRQRLALSLIHI